MGETTSYVDCQDSLRSINTFSLKHLCRCQVSSMLTIILSLYYRPHISRCQHEASVRENFDHMGVLHDEYDTLTVVLHVTSFEYEQPAAACKAQRAGCIIVAATISHPDCFP